MKKTAQVLIFAMLITLVITMLTSCPATPVTLNGEPLESYTIVYSDESDYAKRAAEYIKSSVQALVGVELQVVEDDTAPAEYEIVVGETSRDISKRLDADTEGVEFAILAEEKQIALEGDYFVIAAAAYFFVETYINNEKSVPLGETVHEPIVKEAKNFVLLIGDGMGINQTKLPEHLENNCDYSDGENFFYGYLLPYEGRASTSSLSGVTDSAAAGTALSTGYKTENGYVGQNYLGEDLTSITELALSLGKGAAVMSTEGSTGATPSAFSAHTNSRDNDSEILDDQNVFQYTNGGIIECNYNMYNTSGVKYIQTTINATLEKLAKNEKGFFLMYEEAHIDKHSHSNDIAKAHDAVLRFNQAIATFMEYAFYNPETLVIITADHETGGLTKNADDSYSYTTTSHTGADVPVFAYGSGAELFHNKNIDNTQIPKTVAYFWGVTDFGDQSTLPALQK